MDRSSNFLDKLDIVFRETGVPYMLAGSMASTFYGHPRTTQDADIIIDLDRELLDVLLARFPEEDYYVSREAAEEAVMRRGQFNIIDLQTAWKADLILRKNRPFSRSEFSRRRPARVFGVDVFIATVEDVILTKLEWSQRCGGSERQLRDVQGMIEVRREELDLAYVEEWAQVLGVAERWAALWSARGEPR